MKKRISGYKLNRDSAGRQALLKNLVGSLILKEEIVTTVTKAKAVTPVFEKLLTRAKQGSISARRAVQSYLQTADLTKRLLDDIAPRYKDTHGGYTKLILVGNRRGDNATMARLALTKKTTVAPVKSKAGETAADKKKSQVTSALTPEKVTATKAAPVLVRRTGKRGDK